MSVGQGALRRRTPIAPGAVSMLGDPLVARNGQYFLEPEPVRRAARLIAAAVAPIPSPGVRLQGVMRVRVVRLGRVEDAARSPEVVAASDGFEVARDAWSRRAVASDVQGLACGVG